MSGKDTQMARNEPVKDTARVLSRYVDILAVRTFSQDLLEEMSAFTKIPVINALTDLYHPCQVLSDILTIIEHKGGYKNLKIAWVGDGNNVANSWINAASVLKLDLTLACPKGYTPDPAILKKAQSRKGSNITVTSTPDNAVQDADVIYTDVWVSMGQEKDEAAKKQIFDPYQVNKNLVAKAAKDVIVMHCLPAHRGEEISEEVLEGPHSVVWDQAENKMHMHKAVIEALICNARKT
jgi:ornithine carbamoyltransferase